MFLFQRWVTKYIIFYLNLGTKRHKGFIPATEGKENIFSFIFWLFRNDGSEYRESQSTFITHTHRHTHLDVVLPQVGDDLRLVIVEDFEQDGPSLAVLLQQEQTAVPVLGGGGGAAVLRNRTLIWNTAAHTHKGDTHTHTHTHTHRERMISPQYKKRLIYNSVWRTAGFIYRYKPLLATMCADQSAEAAWVSAAGTCACVHTHTRMRPCTCRCERVRSAASWSS